MGGRWAIDENSAERREKGRVVVVGWAMMEIFARATKAGRSEVAASPRVRARAKRHLDADNV